MKKAVLLVALLACAGILPGQQFPVSKCAPGISVQTTGTSPESYMLTVKDLPVFREWIGTQGIQMEAEYPPANIIIVRATPAELATKILQRPDVLFVDRANRTPKEELPVPGHNLFVNAINAAQALFPALDGSGITVSVKENRFDTSDVDLKNRAAYASGIAQPITAHAKIMATLIGGAGNSDPSGRGVAVGARLFSTGFNNLLPDTNYSMLSIGVQNHSYGVDIENYYGAGAMAYDKSVVLKPSLLHVFSAGNEGLETSPAGAYVGVPGYANLTGNFKMAKNVLTVGAVDSFNQVAPFSSRGPAFDGRTKPDLVAFGQDGTSGSAALVSGAAAVIQQAIFEKAGFFPDASLVRAILLCSADDISPPGPDLASGFGSLNLLEAIELISEQTFDTGAVKSAEFSTFQVDLPDQIAECRITLVWDDLPAESNAPKSLVNNLDLLVTGPDGQEWLPWILNTAPHPDSLRQAARPGRDTLNNTEQVSLQWPSAGVYQIRVAANEIKSTQQPFSLAWDLKKATRFNWKCPLRNDPVVAGSNILLRWESTFQDTVGMLEYKMTTDSGWTRIDSALRIRRGWYRWQVPAIFGEAQARISLNGTWIETDTFLIADALRMQIGFNCPDSVMLFWNSAGQGSTFLLSGLNDRYLEPLRFLTDTFVVLQKQDYPQLRYAVTALGAGGSKGLRSAAPDIRDQGVECYIESFLAELNADDQVELFLKIGTPYGLKSIVFEKTEPDGIRVVQSWPQVEQLGFSALDESPDQGANYYRARLEMLNGSIFWSDTIPIYLTGKGRQVLVFPNPAHYRRIHVLVSTASDATFELYDATGRLILEQVTDEFPEQIDLPAGLPKGLYPYLIREDGRLHAGGVLQIDY